jgi:hypothetical protein
MTICRKGRKPKLNKIMEETKKARSFEELDLILEKFRLTNAEEWQITESWKKEQMILKVHGKGAFAPAPIMV